MEQLYQQALATMHIEDVDFILSQLQNAQNDSQQTPQEPAPVFENETDDDDDGRRRRHIEREWPELNTILNVEYYSQTYTAQIIPANKKLKSGKQILLLDGPAHGTVCDSFSEAMLAATEKQRAGQNLARKGVSNGWVFWQ